MLVLNLFLLLGVSTTHASPRPFSRDLPFVINFFQRFHWQKYLFLIANFLPISALQNLRHRQVSQFWTRWKIIGNKVGCFCEVIKLLQVQPAATRFPLDQLRREARAQARVKQKISFCSQASFWYFGQTIEPITFKCEILKLFRSVFYTRWLSEDHPTLRRGSSGWSGRKIVLSWLQVDNISISCKWIILVLAASG